MFSLLNLKTNIQKFSFRGYPLSTYAEFSEKLTFQIPWYAHVRVRIRDLEMLVFRKILRTYLVDGPLSHMKLLLPKLEYTNLQII